MGLGSLNEALVMLLFGLPVVFSHSIICRIRPSSPSSLPLTVPFVVFMHQPAKSTVKQQWKVVANEFTSQSQNNRLLLGVFTEVNSLNFPKHFKVARDKLRHVFFPAKLLQFLLMSITTNLNGWKLFAWKPLNWWFELPWKLPKTNSSDKQKVALLHKNYKNLRSFWLFSPWTHVINSPFMASRSDLLFSSAPFQRLYEKHVMHFAYAMQKSYKWNHHRVKPTRSSHHFFA